MVDVYVHITKGNMRAASSLASKISPLRLPPKKFCGDMFKDVELGYIVLDSEMR